MNASEQHARRRVIQDIIRAPRQERPRVTAPAPKPEKKRGWNRAGKIGGSAIILTFLGATSLIAQADFTALYPTQCDGGWHQSNQAQVTELKDNQDPAVFTEENSAVWKREGNTAITCTGFENLAAGSRILRLKVGLSWMFKTPSAEQPIESTSTPQEELEQTTPPETDKKENAPELPPPDQNVPEKEQGRDIVPPSDSETLSPQAEESAPSQPQPQPQPPIQGSESTPAPAQDLIVPAPEGAQSFWSHFIAPAYAEDGIPQITATLAFNGLKDFIAIEYSTDGSAWIPVTNADLEIPVKQESDIKTIQVRVRMLRADADLPSVYLDGIWLEAKYRAGDREADDEATGEPSSLTDTIVDAISEIPQTIADAVAPEPEAVTIETTEAPKAPVVAPEPVVVFKFETANEQERLLAQIRSIIGNQRKTDSAVQIESEGKAISLAWPCSDAYGTVLLFEHPDDVTRDPAKAIVNRANACVNGTVSHMIREEDLPRTLPSGVYTLFAADQDAVGVWKLTGKVYSIAIKRTIELK